MHSWPATTPPLATMLHVNLKHFRYHIRFQIIVFDTSAANGGCGISERGLDSGAGWPVIYCRRQSWLLSITLLCERFDCAVCTRLQLFMCIWHCGCFHSQHTKNVTKDTRVSSVIQNLFGRAFLFVKLSVLGHSQSTSQYTSVYFAFTLTQRKCTEIPVNCGF